MLCYLQGKFNVFLRFISRRARSTSQGVNSWFKMPRTVSANCKKKETSSNTGKEWLVFDRWESALHCWPLMSSVAPQCFLLLSHWPRQWPSLKAAPVTLGHGSHFILPRRRWSWRNKWLRTGNLKKGIVTETTIYFKFSQSFASNTETTRSPWLLGGVKRTKLEEQNRYQDKQNITRGNNWHKSDLRRSATRPLRE